MAPKDTALHPRGKPKSQLQTPSPLDAAPLPQYTFPYMPSKDVNNSFSLEASVMEPTAVVILFGLLFGVPVEPTPVPVLRPGRIILEAQNDNADMKRLTEEPIDELFKEAPADKPAGEAKKDDKPGYTEIDPGAPAWAKLGADKEKTAQRSLEVILVVRSAPSMQKVNDQLKKDLPLLIESLKKAVPSARVGLVRYLDAPADPADDTRDLTLAIATPTDDPPPLVKFLELTQLPKGTVFPRNVPTALGMALKEGSPGRIVILLGDAAVGDDETRKSTLVVRIATSQGVVQVHAIDSSPCSVGEVKPAADDFQTIVGKPRFEQLKRPEDLLDVLRRHGLAEPDPVPLGGEISRLPAPRKDPPPLAEQGWGGYIKQLQNDGLDVVIVFDSTSSMGVHVLAIKNHVQQLMSAITYLVPNARLGLVAYRDLREFDPTEYEYITRIQPLTTDVKVLQKFLEPAKAYGGGDRPEAVFQGLEAATKMVWRKNARKVIILVGDAPPHHENDGLKKVNDLCKKWSDERKGIICAIDANTAPGSIPMREFTALAKAGAGEATLIQKQDLIAQIFIYTFGSQWEKEARKVYDTVTKGPAEVKLIE